MNNLKNCACRPLTLLEEIEQKQGKIILCPLHKTAPKLLKCLKIALQWMDGQEHLHGLTASGKFLYRTNVELMKKTVIHAEGK